VEVSRYCLGSVTYSYFKRGEARITSRIAPRGSASGSVERCLDCRHMRARRGNPADWAAHFRLIPRGGAMVLDSLTEAMAEEQLAATLLAGFTSHEQAQEPYAYPTIRCGLVLRSRTS
jgi:hypothetical protein